MFEQRMSRSVVNKMEFPPFTPRDTSARVVFPSSIDTTNTVEVIGKMESELPPASALQQ